MRGLIWGVAAAIFAQQVLAKEPNVSAYTELDLAKCQVVAQNPEAESVTWRCAGFAGIPVLVAEGDLRMFVSFGENAAKERAFEQTFGPFNRIHTTLEWRLASTTSGERVPIATILRYFLAADGKPEHQILVVTQLKPGATCHIAYVDAIVNANANEDARSAADRLAGDFDCEREPELVGRQAPGIFME